jgi:hypothetical protein
LVRDVEKNLAAFLVQGSKLPGRWRNVRAWLSLGASIARTLPLQTYAVERRGAGSSPW